MAEAIFHCWEGPKLGLGSASNRVTYGKAHPRSHPIRKTGEMLLRAALGPRHSKALDLSIMKPVGDIADAVTEFASSTGLSAFVGRHFYGADYYEVGREKIREYAGVTQSGHPAHRFESAARELGYSGLLAPPTFFSMAATMIQGVLLGAFVDGSEFRSVIQTDQQTELHRPIVADDRLDCEVWIDSYRQAFGGDLIGLTSVLTDSAGLPVVTSRTRLASRADLDERVVEEMRNVLMRSVGPTPALLHERRSGSGDGIAASGTSREARRSNFTVDHLRSFTAIAVGAELPSRTVFLTPGDLVRYAGVSGDPNPIHWSPRIAGLLGLDSVVAQGMLTIGIGAGFVAAYLDDPGAISAYRVRLTSPVFVGTEGATMEFGGRVKSIDRAAGTVTVVIAAKQAGRAIFGRAELTVRLHDDAGMHLRPAAPQ
ncbi:fused (3R)-hydroxyacyl-ACP dehydratase subunits HadA/HadB [Nocardia brasiliensis]|uniref:fused (3R)-hydroxyacyl-ACP dehydratase subunits HadA/HadB n=1 Tax=Nocardia brasiliensis TaxID=37326 RepID=UPI0024555276|nr:fused (3R)-hydroxyacyl-ACP dehydratase subunits HadA/HadB [Nocardia brasiliensis]